MTPQKKFMKMAIDDVTTHFSKAPGGPFGACIVQGEKVLAVAHNTVIEQHDPTCHAEINAIRNAAKLLGTHDLSGCTIYSTTEPCPMCFSAIHWAGIDSIVFGTRIPDVQALGFNELEISCDTMQQTGKSKVSLVGDFMRDDCLQLLERWQRETPAKTY